MLVGEGSAAPCVVINGKSCGFSFALDAFEVVAQLSQDFLPPSQHDKVCALCGGVCVWLWCACMRGRSAQAACAAAARGTIKPPEAPAPHPAPHTGAARGWPGPAQRLRGVAE